MWIKQAHVNYLELSTALKPNITHLKTNKCKYCFKYKMS